MELRRAVKQKTKRNNPQDRSQGEPARKPIRKPLVVEEETLNIRFENQPQGSALLPKRTRQLLIRAEKHKRRIKDEQVFGQLLLEVWDAVWVGRNAAVCRLSGRHAGSHWWATYG